MGYKHFRNKMFLIDQSCLWLDVQHMPFSTFTTDCDYFMANSAEFPNNIEGMIADTDECLIPFDVVLLC